MIVKPFLDFFDALAGTGACTGSQAREAKKGLVDLRVGWRDMRCSLAAAATAAGAPSLALFGPTQRQKRR